MVESNREAWHEITKRTQDTGADGIELTFGCPHGMSERGMGSAVGQVPDYTCMITEWVKEVATIPVLVKLTPHVGDRGGRRSGPLRREAGGAGTGQPGRLVRPGGEAGGAAHGLGVGQRPRSHG